MAASSFASSHLPSFNASVSFLLYTPICQGSRPLASSFGLLNFATADLYSRGRASNGNRPYFSRRIKWLRRSAEVLEIASRGSVTCCNRKPRFASKNSRKPCGSRSGSVSMALLTTSLCPFLPHAAARGGRSAHKHPSTTNASANLNKYPGHHKSNIHSLTCTFNDSLPRIWMQVLIFTTVYFFPQEALGKAKSRLKFRTPMLPKSIPSKPRRRTNNFLIVSA